MTTIAADHRSGVMVSDSRCVEGGTWFPCTKVFRIGAELVGCAGDVNEWQQWLKWYRAGRKGAMPKLTEFSALILRSEGLYGFGDDGCEMLMERGFHAVGSGHHAALAALILGHDAKAAVEVACEVDSGTGGEIRVYNLKDAE